MNRNILLVDDEPNVLNGLTRQLQDDFEIVLAEGGAEAVEQVRLAENQGIEFAVVVCDNRMPGMDGFVTLEKIHELSPMTIAIMLTGHVDLATVIAAVNRGLLYRFLVKPSAKAELLEAIGAGIRQHHLLKSEKLLSQNEERLRLALQAVGDGVWDWNPKTGEATFALGWWQMLGYPDNPGEKTIESWWRRVHPDDFSMVNEQVSRLLVEAEDGLRAEHRLRMADGTYRWFLARGSVQKDQENTVARIVGTHTDVTQYHWFPQPK